MSCKITDDGIAEIFSANEPMPLKVINVPRVYNSPCPKIFRYIFDGKEWSGVVMIKNPAPKGKPSETKVVLSIGFRYTSVSEILKIILSHALLILIQEQR